MGVRYSLKSKLNGMWWGIRVHIVRVEVNMKWERGAVVFVESYSR